MGKDRVDELRKQILDLERRWPAHSVPPALMQQLDELEQELSQELEKRANSDLKAETLKAVLQLSPIGLVENQFDQIASVDQIRSVESRIILEPSLTEGLQGFEPGQEIMVVYYFHLSSGFDLLQHPHGDQSRPKRGVFTLRSPRRPNPIGVTTVVLIGIEGNVLTVRGLDAINGTPVLDIKLV